MFVLNFLALLLMAYLGWAVLFQLVPAIAGKFFKSEKGSPDSRLRRFGVLIPAYKEDQVILGTVKSALEQNYPSDHFEVVPIADQLSASTIRQIRDLGVEPLVVNFEESTKAKSLNAALEYLGEGYDAVVVLDADNHPEKDFLLNMNIALGKGLQAVQGSRIAKNHNNSMAILDGVSEAVNNHLLCSGQRAMGFSARLAGSGMAFDFTLFKNVMQDINALGGFDKELELKLTKNGVKIGFAPEAKVLDEKVDNTATFSRQRGRWLAAQYRYGRRFGPTAVRDLLLKGNIDFFNKTLQMALPPRLFLPGVLAVGTVASLLFSWDSSYIWVALLIGNLTAFALAIPRHYWGRDFFHALLDLPKAFLAMLKALTLIPLAAKSFLHTPHGTASSIE